MKHLIRNKQNTEQKLQSTLKLHSPSSNANRLTAPQMHTSLNTNSQFSTKPVASQSLQYRRKLPFAPQITLSNSIVNPHLNIPFATQMPLKIQNQKMNHITSKQIIHIPLPICCKSSEKVRR